MDTTPTNPGNPLIPDGPRGLDGLIEDEFTGALAVERFMSGYLETPRRQPSVLAAEEFARRITMSASAPADVSTAESFADRFFAAPQGGYASQVGGATSAGAAAAQGLAGEEAHVWEFNLGDLEYVVIEEKEEFIVINAEGAVAVKRTSSFADRLQSAITERRASRDDRRVGPGGAVAPRAYFVSRHGELSKLDLKALADALREQGDETARREPLPKISQPSRKLMDFSPTERKLSSSRAARLSPRDTGLPAQRKGQQAVPRPEQVRREIQILERQPIVIQGGRVVAQAGAPRVSTVGGAARAWTGVLPRWLTSSMLSGAGAVATGGAGYAMLADDTYAVKTAGGGVAIVRRPTKVSVGEAAEAQAGERTRSLAAAGFGGAGAVPAWAQPYLEGRRSDRFWKQPDEMAQQQGAAIAGPAYEGAPQAGDLLEMRGAALEGGAPAGDNFWLDWAMRNSGRMRRRVLGQTPLAGTTPPPGSGAAPQGPFSIVDGGPDGTLSSPPARADGSLSVRREALRTGALPPLAMQSLMTALEHSASKLGFRLPPVRFRIDPAAFARGDAMATALGKEGALPTYTVSLARAPEMERSPLGTTQLARMMISLPFPSDGELVVGPELSHALETFLVSAPRPGGTAATPGTPGQIDMSVGSGGVTLTSAAAMGGGALAGAGLGLGLGAFAGFGMAAGAGALPGLGGGAPGELPAGRTGTVLSVGDTGRVIGPPGGKWNFSTAMASGGSGLLAAAMGQAGGEWAPGGAGMVPLAVDGYPGQLGGMATLNMELATPTPGETQEVAVPLPLWRQMAMGAQTYPNMVVNLMGPAAGTSPVLRVLWEATGRLAGDAIGQADVLPRNVELTIASPQSRGAEGGGDTLKLEVTGPKGLGSGGTGSSFGGAMPGSSGGIGGLGNFAGTRAPDLAGSDRSLAALDAAAKAVGGAGNLGVGGAAGKAGAGVAGAARAGAGPALNLPDLSGLGSAEFAVGDAGVPGSSAGGGFDSSGGTSGGSKRRGGGFSKPDARKAAPPPPSMALRGQRYGRWWEAGLFPRSLGGSYSSAAVGGFGPYVPNVFAGIRQSAGTPYAWLKWAWPTGPSWAPGEAAARTGGAMFAGAGLGGAALGGAIGARWEKSADRVGSRRGRGPGAGGTEGNYATPGMDDAAVVTVAGEGGAPAMAAPAGAAALGAALGAAGGAAVVAASQMRDAAAARAAPAGTSIDMTVVSAIPPKPPSLSDMQLAGAQAHTAKPARKAIENAEARQNAMGLHGTVDSLAQRIYHRLRRRLEQDRERFGGW